MQQGMEVIRAGVVGEDDPKFLVDNPCRTTMIRINPVGDPLSHPALERALGVARESAQTRDGCRWESQRRGWGSNLRCTLQHRRDMMARYIFLLLTAALLCLATPAWCDTFTFVTGPPDGRLAVAVRIPDAAHIEIETGDDFFTTATRTTITGASFFGLLPSSSVISSIVQVDVEIYRIFPLDSVNPPDGRVPTRTNSPADNAFDTRDSAVAGQLTFTVTGLGSFAAANSVLNGIFPIPNQKTGGEGPVSGTQGRIDVVFTSPFTLPPGHYFFVP